MAMSRLLQSVQKGRSPGFWKSQKTCEGNLAKDYSKICHNHLILQIKWLYNIQVLKASYLSVHTSAKIYHTVFLNSLVGQLLPNLILKNATEQPRFT